jgi:hypothetical protein
MHEWLVTLTQSGHRFATRETSVLLFAVDALQAARRAQRVLPGWTAVMVEKRP